MHGSVCVLVCMFHSLIFTMASNIQAEEDEPMHPAGLDMTRGSLQDILDGEDVNVSTALLTVPLDATNPFINPNQTLADIIPDRNLGPLASLKIRDNLEKEYADKEQNYIRQLKQELRAKTSTIRDQCKMEFDQELKKLKEEWNQERLKTNEQHNVQISQVLKEIDALKEHSRTQQKGEVVEPGDKNLRPKNYGLRLCTRHSKH